MRHIIFSLFLISCVLNTFAQSEVYQSLDTLNQKYIVYHTAHFSNCNMNPTTIMEPQTNNNIWMVDLYYNSVGPSPNAPCLKYDTLFTEIPFGSNSVHTLITHSNRIAPTINDTITNTSIDTLYINSLSIIENIDEVPVSTNNPIKGTLEFYFQDSFKQPNSLEIWNGLGQYITTLPFDKTVDVSFLRRGFYFVRVNNQSIKFYKK